MRHVESVLAVLGALGLAVQPCAAQPASDIKILSTVEVTGDDWAGSPEAPGTFVFLTPFSCDTQGNAFLLPYQSPGPGGIAKVVVRVSVDGVRRVLDMAHAMALPDGDVRISLIATDRAGHLFALGTVGASEVGRRHVVSLDTAGTLRSRMSVDETAVSVERFSVLGNGDLLLFGSDPRLLEARAVVVPASGGPPRILNSPFASSHPGGPVHAVSGSDGRVYAAQTGAGVAVFGLSGELERRFDLLPPGPSSSLMGLQFSGTRVAAVFQGELPGGQGGVGRWVVVHEAATGKPVATHGPLPGRLLCFRHAAGSDQFTFLATGKGGGWLLQTGVAP